MVETNKMLLSLSIVLLSMGYSAYASFDDPVTGDGFGSGSDEESSVLSEGYASAPERFLSAAQNGFKTIKDKVGFGESHEDVPVSSDEQPDEPQEAIEDEAPSAVDKELEAQGYISPSDSSDTSDSDEYTTPLEGDVHEPLTLRVASDEESSDEEIVVVEDKDAGSDADNGYGTDKVEIKPEELAVAKTTESTGMMTILQDVLWNKYTAIVAAVGVLGYGAYWLYRHGAAVLSKYICGYDVHELTEKQRSCLKNFVVALQLDDMQACAHCDFACLPDDLAQQCSVLQEYIVQMGNRTRSEHEQQEFELLKDQVIHLFTTILSFSEQEVDGSDDVSSTDNGALSPTA